MITVLMPVFNAETHLRAAIESILGQTLKDFEFLIIDDGSRDESRRIVSSYRDPRIRFVRNPCNLGISETLNRGLALARHELVARMDADDISHPERLAMQLRYMENHLDCSLVASAARVVAEDGTFLFQGKLKSEQLYYFLTFVCWIYHPTVLYRRSAVQKVGGYTRFYGEDYTLWCRLSRKNRIHLMPETLLDYRKSSGSLCSATHAREYVSAEKDQIRENLEYFLGRRCELPDRYLDAYRDDFSSMLQLGAVGDMVACIEELDAISRAVEAKENVNREVEAIRKAAAKKRHRTIAGLIGGLPLRVRIDLLRRVGGIRFVARSMRRMVRRQDPVPS
jgi:hypothetical protein